MAMMTTVELAIETLIDSAFRIMALGKFEDISKLQAMHNVVASVYDEPEAEVMQKMLELLMERIQK